MYAAKSKQDTMVLNSSSGGIFGEIAHYFLENNGIVYGAAYDQQLSVNHIRVDENKNLWKIQGSKYVQSNLNDVYSLADLHAKFLDYILF